MSSSYKELLDMVAASRARRPGSNEERASSGLPTTSDRLLHHTQSCGQQAMRATNLRDPPPFTALNARHCRSLTISTCAHSLNTATAHSPTPGPGTPISTSLFALPEEILIAISMYIPAEDMTNWITCSRKLRPLARSPHLAAAWAWHQQDQTAPGKLRAVLDRCSSPAQVVASLRQSCGHCACTLWRSHQQQLATLARRTSKPAVTTPDTCSADSQPDFRRSGTDSNRGSEGGKPPSVSDSLSMNTGALQLLQFVCAWAAKAGCTDTLNWVSCTHNKISSSMGTQTRMYQANDKGGLDSRCATCHATAPCCLMPDAYKHVLSNGLLKATAHGRVHVMGDLLKLGADVHAEHDRALRWACIVGRPDVVQLLLSYGANVHALGGFSLQVANQHAHASVLQLLKAHGACRPVPLFPQ